MVLYPNKLPESERVCSGICSNFFLNGEAYFCAAKIKRKETDDARQY